MEITAMSGEYPIENILRMMSSASYAKKVVSALINDKLIKTVSTGGLKGYRLTLKGKKTLIKDNPARFAGFLDGTAETNKMRTGYERRLRLHSIAEVCTLMYFADVEIFQGVKQKIYLRDSPVAPSQPTKENSEGNTSSKVNNYALTGNPPQNPPTIIKPCFYTSREQKGQDDNAIRGSRAVGTLLTPTHVYAVYNTGSRESRWSKDIEQRFRVEVQNNICRKLLFSQYEGSDVGGIMIGNELETLAKYLDVKDKQQTGFHFLSRTYQPFYYITNDIYGEVQLKILCDRGRMASLQGTLLNKLNPPDTKYHIVHDAMAQDGIPVLFCCLLDIPRLISFKDGVTLHNQSAQVIAFDFQAKMLKAYLGNSVQIRALNFEKIVKWLFPNG